jgi:hypothetical protein
MLNLVIRMEYRVFCCLKLYDDTAIDSQFFKQLIVIMLSINIINILILTKKLWNSYHNKGSNRR